MSRLPSKSVSSAHVRRRLAAMALAVLPAVCGPFTGCDSPVEPPPEAQAGSHDSIGPGGQERATFDRLIKEWRTVVGGMAKLDVQFRIIGTRDDPEIRRRFDELRARGDELQPQLIEAAMVAYAKHPSANEDLIGFLGAVAALEAAREEFEVATRIFQQLVDNGVESQALYELAIPSAFNSNDFELTEKYLALEKEKNLHFGAVVSPEYREKLGYYKNAWEREQQLRAAELEANDLPRVKLRTNKGEIELELFENEAPNTVANFIAMVESSFYNDLTFFRVVARDLAEAGCPVGDGTGGPNHQIVSECRVPNRRTHFRGSVTMMTSDSFTNGSVFGICLIPAGEMDGQHTVFGRVIRGMDVLSKLQRRAPRDEMSEVINPNANVVIPPADRIIAATVVRKRDHPYQPKVIIGTPPTTKAAEPALE